MNIPVKDLRIGKIKDDFIFLNQYLMEEGKENRSLFNSPHYVLLEEYEKNPHLDLTKTDYFRFARAHLIHFGRWFGFKDTAGIVTHIKQFLSLYEDIKKQGYDYSKGRIVVFRNVIGEKSIDALGRPHPPTETYVPENYEIYEGHHRAAILAKLGYHEVDVDFYSKGMLLKNKVMGLGYKITHKLPWIKK